MKMMKRIKKGSAWLLALTLVLSSAAIVKVQAANGIDTEKRCSISFQLEGNLNEEFAELNELTVPVKLYRVADVSSSGVYTALEGFQELKLDEVDSETTAAQWEEKAAKAVEILEESETEAAAETNIEKGSGKAENLETGMYLVAAQETLSNLYAYRFTPYLISLPNNYYSTGENDDWVYDVSTGLKPEKEALFGSLVIDKTLTSFNQTLGNATFVFSIEGVKTGEDGKSESVYSDVVSVVFDHAGTKSITVTGIPAGADVTVTEIYSGASYEASGAVSQTVKIAADSREEEGEDAANAVHVSFTNQYNNGLNGGASVVNHFEKTEGGWDWTTQDDSTGTQQ